MKTHIPSRRPAFTLLELSLSMAVTVVLMGGLATALLLTARAIPSGDDSMAAVLRGGRAAEQIAADMFVARSISTNTANAIEFTVADRNQDASPETIRYEWSGVLGDPLTRQYNGGTVTDLLSDVHDFGLTYSLSTSEQDGGLGPVKLFPSEPILYLEHDGTTSVLKYLVSTNTWCAQYFAPDPDTLPTGATTWKLTAIQFRLRSAGSADGLTTAEIRNVDDSGFPGGTVYDNLVIDESFLDSTAWMSPPWALAGIPTLPITDGLCLVLRPSMGMDTCYVKFQAKTTTVDNGYFLASSDGGASFTKRVNKTMTEFYTYATVTTPGDPITITVERLQSVGIEIQTGSNPDNSVQTGVRVLNMPLVSGS